MALLSDMRIIRLNASFPVRTIITIAKIVGYCLPFRNSSGLFFFFPFCHVGGAERVHADIVECFSREKPWVFFTKKSDNEKFRHFFTGGRTFNFWLFCKYGYPFSIGILAGFINRHRKAAVFGSNSLVYYLLLPYLRPDIRKTDLLHAFGGASDEFSLPQVSRLDQRVIITCKTRDDLADQYRSAGINPCFLERVILIENKIPVPVTCPPKPRDSAIKVIFVGRGAPEKRIHLIGRAASLCREKHVPVNFVFVGETREAVNISDRKSCTFLGEVSDSSELRKIYSNADVLVLTSSREGFPMVIMEAMAHGVVPVCTSVGGIPRHIHHTVNGLLLENNGEERIVEQLAHAITRLSDNRNELSELSRNAFAYARDHFSGDSFCASYRNVILGQTNTGAP